MSRTVKSTKQRRRRYSPEYKTEALALSEQIGASEAAKRLKIQRSQIYTWKASALKADERGIAEQQLESENARLKRELAESKMEVAILKKASAYFARHLT